MELKLTEGGDHVSRTAIGNVAVTVRTTVMVASPAEITTEELRLQIGSVT